jgi:hypothetical protein
MNAVELLKREVHRFRRYETTKMLLDVVSYTLADYRERFPDQIWEDYIREVRPGHGSQLAICDTRPLVRWGPADTSIIRTKLGVELPEWMEDFYNQVTCAMLPMLNQIAIMTPEESVAYELDRKEQLDEVGLPCRLIRFANGDPTGVGFSLYKRLEDDQWMIVVSQYGTTTPLSRDDDWEYEWADLNINEWMARMFLTDGHPLFKGREEYEPMNCRRLA